MGFLPRESHLPLRISRLLDQLKSNLLLVNERLKKRGARTDNLCVSCRFTSPEYLVYDCMVPGAVFV